MPVRPESAHWRYRATTHAVRTVPTIASATLRHASRPIGMLRSRFTVPVLQLVGALQPGRLERGLERVRAHSADRLRALNRPGMSGDPGAGPGGGAGCTSHGGGSGLFSL